MCKQSNKEQSSNKLQIVLENALILFNIALGAWAMWSIPYLPYVYIVFVAFMVGIFLRKHLCTHCCYYGKACHCGWGKLAAVFKQYSGNENLAKVFAPLTWAVLMVLPLIACIVLAIISFTWMRVLQIVLLVMFILFQTIIHRNDCRKCDMRDRCVGAM